MKRLLAVLMMLMLIACAASAEQVTFTPGIYTVDTLGHNGAMTVEVTFDEHSITDIKVPVHAETRRIGDISMNTVIDEILERQSLDVDTVAGATVSGAVVRAAVRKAVEQAGADPAKLMIPKAKDETVYQDETTQVVIVGSGVAGLVTAVEAQAQGLDIILIEQLGFLGGSSIRAAYMVGGGSSVQKAQGIDYGVENWQAF